MFEYVDRLRQKDRARETGAHGKRDTLADLIGGWIRWEVAGKTG